jgi:hypothetical protein
MTIKTNLSEVLTNLIAQMNEQLGKQITREIAVSLLPVVHDRIHVDGQDSNSAQIGTYSKGYLAIRSGTFGNSETNKKGKNKGAKKNAGTTTKGANAGSKRTNYNRGTDPTVILSLTRQMENDFSVQETPLGYGLGYNNILNYDKAKWNELRFNKLIFGLTNEEQLIANEVAQIAMTNALSK